MCGNIEGMKEERFAKIIKGADLSEDEKWILREYIGLPVGSPPASLVSLGKGSIHRIRGSVLEKLKPKQ